MDNYEKIAEGVVVNRIRSSCIELFKLYNDQAAEKGLRLSMAFVLLTINEKFGTPVTKIAPRMSMEPNSLSRILKAMEKKGAIYKRKDKSDKRKVYIFLTEYGIELRDLAAQRLFSFEKAIHEKVNKNDIIAFFRVMDTIPNVVDSLKKNK